MNATTLEKEIMVKSQNELINSKFQLSQVELDLMFYLLSLIKEDCKTYSFRVSDMYQLIGKEWKGSQIMPNCKSLMTRHLLRMIDEKHWELINLFEKISYDDGIVEMVITTDAARILSDSVNNYTLMELRSALRLKSKYSKRLYWLLCMWRSRGQIHYLLDELRNHLGVCEYNTRNECVANAYPENGIFKHRCEEWVAEINEQTDLCVKTQWCKKGRTIDGVFFYLSRKYSNSALESYSDDVERRKAVTLFQNYGLTENQALEVWGRGCTIDIFNKITAGVNKKIQNSKGEVWNPVGFLIGTLEKKGYISKQKSDLNQLAKKRKEENFMSERAGVIKGMRCAIDIGVSIESMRETMDMYGISEKELLES